MFHDHKSGNRNYTLFDILLALAVLIFLFVSWNPGSKAGAQVLPPGPAPECYWIGDEWLCVSHVELTPFVPTATPLPAPTIAPTVTPVGTIVITPIHFVYLASIYRGAE